MPSSPVPAHTNEIIAPSNDGCESSDTHGNGLLVISTPNPTGPMVSYTRSELLEFKESKLCEYLDEKQMLTSSKILLKILKPECKLLQRQSKPQDNSGIVLGPQKRSWNIGCHVSQSKRSPQDSSGLKTPKSFLDNKYSRGDFKRDSKGSERYTGKSGYSGNGSFIRGGVQGKGDSGGRHRLSDPFQGGEKEPEWFTEGPESINDTVELGRLIEDDAKDMNSPPPDSDKAPEFDNPADVDSAILYTGKSEPSQTSPKENDVDLGLSELARSAEEGSRFRHLFEKSTPITPERSNFKINSSSDNVSSRLLQLLASSGDPPTAVKRAPTVPPSKPSANDLESALRSLLLGSGNATQISTHLSPAHTQDSEGVDPSKQARSASLVHRAPTVEEIEAATFRGTSRPSLQAVSQQCQQQQQSKQAPPAALLDQLSRSWSSAKQQARPLSGDFDAPTGAPISIEALEAIQLRESATRLTGRPAGSDRNIAANMALSHQHRNSASSSAANPTSALLNSFLMAKMQQQQNRQQPPPQAPLSMMPPPGLMPTDPAIAFHMSQAQRRPIMKNHATISTHNDPMIMASTYHQRLDQQSQFFDSADNYGSEASHGFRPGSSMEATLMQLKRSVDGTNNANPSIHGPFSGSGLNPSSLFCHRGGVAINNCAPTTNSALEQLLINSARGGANNIPTYHSINNSNNSNPNIPNIRQNLSAPNLLLPTRWQAVAAAGMLRSRGGIAEGGISSTSQHHLHPPPVLEFVTPTNNREN